MARKNLAVSGKSQTGSTTTRNEENHDSLDDFEVSDISETLESIIQNLPDRSKTDKNFMKSQNQKDPDYLDDPTSSSNKRDSSRTSESQQPLLDDLEISTFD